MNLNDMCTMKKYRIVHVEWAILQAKAYSLAGVLDTICLCNKSRHSECTALHWRFRIVSIVGN
jgi:hypothetical protein